MLIVQISDIHLKPEGQLAYDAADTADALRKVVQHILGLNPTPDAVIVTGDIADGGRRESYHVARELLSPIQLPIFMIPGNHDHKATLKEVFGDHTYLCNNSVPAIGDFICYSIDNYAVRLIGLDTVTPGDHGGGLCAQRLAWLDQTLAKRPEAPTLVFMHHPPFPSAVGHMDLEPFRHRDRLEALIARHPQVERLTCGHIHRPLMRRFAGTLATVCPGVGMQIPMDLRPEAASGFVLGPPGILMHYYGAGWGDPPSLISHVDLVEDYPGQFGSFYPFVNVVSPK